MLFQDRDDERLHGHIFICRKRPVLFLGRLLGRMVSIRGLHAKGAARENQQCRDRNETKWQRATKTDIRLQIFILDHSRQYSVNTPKSSPKS